MKRTIPSLSRRVGAIGLAMAALAVAACTKNDEATGPSLVLAPRVEITSVAGDTTSALLAAIYARSMENAGVRVVRKDPVDMDRAAYTQAILDGTFQMIPEFSRDLLQFVLADTPTDSTPTTEAVTATTRAPITIPTTTTTPATTTPESTTPGTGTGADTTAAATTEATTTTVPPTTAPATSAAPSSSAGESTTTTNPPTNGHSVSAQLVAINSSIDSNLLAYGATIAEDRTVVACTQAYVEKSAAYQLYTITDLASIAPTARFAGPATYLADDAEGLPQLLKVYAAQFAETLTIESADVAAAVDADTADCFAINSLDPVITAKNLRILYDDQYMIPMNMGIALLAATAATPEVTSALDKVASALTTDKLNQLLREIEENGTDLTVVANAFVDNIPDTQA